MRGRIIFIAFLLRYFMCFSQHEHHMHDPDSGMSHSFSKHLPMERNGSGTGWMPDASIMYGHGYRTGKWMLMLHANLFLRYNWQDITEKGSRGGEKFDVPGWLMYMGQRNTGDNGLFRFSIMISPDPFSVGEEGYPLLFQTGETYNGQPLIDRQHPHDLFSELSVAYSISFSEKTDLSIYLGYPGEPALGPVAFMHRTSALHNPDAPLGHHWQDATHITFGVGTIGLRYGKFKLEGSLFTGREPDEERYGFDEPRFDSYSGRLQFAASREMVMQVSRAFIKYPEFYNPGDIKRTTASLIYHRNFYAPHRYLSASLVWGSNEEEDHASHSILLEPLLQIGRSAVYSRYEFIQKSAEELGVAPNGHELYNIQNITAGISQILLRKAGNNLSVGVQGTLSHAPELESVYGKNPLSLEVYIRLYPHTMHMHQH